MKPALILFFMLFCSLVKAQEVEMTLEEVGKRFSKDTIAREQKVTSPDTTAVQPKDQMNKIEVLSKFHLGKIYKDLQIYDSSREEKVRGTIAAGSQILKIDEMDEYSLVCFGSLCGYVNNKELTAAITKIPEK